jgi:hypothetical protein
MEPIGRLRSEASGAPVFAQRPLLIPQGDSWLSLVLMPQELPSNASTRSTRQKQSILSLTTRSTSLDQASSTNRSPPVNYSSSFAGEHTVAVVSTPESSVVEIEEDHLLPTNRIVCYPGNDCVPYEPPKYLIDTDQKGSVALKAFAYLLLSLVLVLAVVAAILYFVVLKDDSNRVPTIPPTAESCVGTQPTPGTFASTVSCSGRITTISRAAHLSLHNNSLNGFVPSELCKLTSLTILSLDGNELSGTLPSELGELSKLGEFLDRKTKDIHKSPCLGETYAVLFMSISISARGADIARQCFDHRPRPRRALQLESGGNYDFYHSMSEAGDQFGGIRGPTLLLACIGPRS